MDNERLSRIKEKLEKLRNLDSKHEIFGSPKHAYGMNPKKTAEELEKFAAAYNLDLPEEYKEYLVQIANGGAGPYYGLYSLEAGIEQADRYSTEENEHLTNAFSKEFPFNNAKTKKFIEYYNACREEGDDDEIEYLKVPDPFTGVIFLADFGCGWDYILVVKGEQAGTIWITGDYLSPCFEGDVQWGFFDWYEDWLDKSLKAFDPLSTNLKLQFGKDTKIINYDGWKLKEIPPAIFECKNLKKFVFSRNDLSEFPKAILQFSKLRTLDLSMTSIIHIPEEIKVLKELKKLRLNYNNHLSLPESLQELKKLEELSMYYNYQIAKIPEVIGRISSLKQIYFSNCGELREISENIGNLKNLEKLVLNDCAFLESLPKSIVELEKLTFLDLGRTQIKKLPANFQKLTELEFLGIDIDELDLEDALQQIKQLPRLRSLKIVNQLQYPEALSELKSLKTLTITQNYNLRQQGHKTFPLPEQLTLIPNLESLDLMNNNQVSGLPANIGHLRQLRTLEIGATAIKEFPDSFKELSHLEKIEGSLEQNPSSPYGIRLEEKEKIMKWFPKAKIWIW